MGKYICIFRGVAPTHKKKIRSPLRLPPGHLPGEGEKKKNRVTGRRLFLKIEDMKTCQKKKRKGNKRQ